MNLRHIDMQTKDGAQLNLDALYQIAPSCFTEAKGEDGEMHRVIDFNKLRLLLGDQAVEDAPEVYDFTWVGKRAALREAAAPINKTLRPCPEESVDWEHTQNLYIEGDNLEVLKLLQNSYMGKVKMIDLTFEALHITSNLQRSRYLWCSSELRRIVEYGYELLTAISLDRTHS